MQGLVSGIFAFLLTILFTILFLCAGFGFGVFNKVSIIRNLNESNYYYEVQDTINKNAEEAAVKAGLPAQVITDVITVERVYIGEKNYVEAALRGKSEDINTDKLREDLTLSINQYLLGKGVTPTEELDAGVNTLVSAVETDYKNVIQLQFVNLLTEYKAEFINLMKYVIPSLIILIGALCFFLIRMHHYKHRGVRYIIYALASASLIIILSAVYLLFTKQYGKLDISPEYYHNFIISYFYYNIMR
jgi:hypothetical protein